MVNIFNTKQSHKTLLPAPPLLPPESCTSRVQEIEKRYGWSAFLALTNCLFKKHTPFITTIFINDWFWSVLYLFSSFWTLFLEWKGCNSIYHFRSDGVPMRKVSPGNPSPLMERKNQNTQNQGRLTKMFTERFDEVIFEPLLFIDNLVYLFIIFFEIQS